MAVTESYLTYIQDQLDNFGSFESKKMFGGIGFFKEGRMFGLIAKDVFMLKVDAQNLPDFEAYASELSGLEDVMPKIPYRRVPESVLSHPSELTQWAQKAFDAALRSKRKK